MLPKISFITFLVIIININGCYAKGYYRVIGPRLIRPNSEYHVAVSTQGTSIPTRVTIAVVGRQTSGRVYQVEQSLVVEPYSTRIARLEIGDIENGDYRLISRGSGGVVFDQSSVLKYLQKSYTAFIQTDKAVYKPEHKILFRAIILNSQLKPAAEVRSEPLTISISDGANNVVKQWKKVTASRGVFTGEHQLSKSPVLGDWHISVTIHGQVFNRTIQVAEYVLPKFLIDIQTKKHVTFAENTISTVITSLYKYGRKVKGDATVTIYPTIISGVIQPIFQNPIRKVIPIDGTASVEFDISKDLKLRDEYERNVIIDVIVEEALTGRRQNNSIEIQIHKYDYKMDLIKTSDYYKPGMKYTAYIKVYNHDGTPIKDDRREVIVRHGYSKVDEIYKEDVYKLNRNGIVELTFDTPEEATNATALRIEAKYMDLKEWFSPVPAAISSSGTYLLATLETERPIVNQDVEILLNCSEPMKLISYELFGRGDVLLANTLQIRNEMAYRFHFTAIHAMVPVAHLVVHYVRDDGELVADSLDIEIDGLLQNFIDIQLNSAEARPGDEIDLTVRAQPNSYVGLLAVDENVAALKNGYDIVQSQVSSELGKFDAADVSPYQAIQRDQHRHFFWKPGSSNAHDIFFNSGAILVTNSLVSNYRPTLEDVYLRPPNYGSATVKPDRGPGVSFQTVTRPPLAGQYAFSRIPRPVWDKPKVYLSQDVQDTWLFTNFSSGFEGKTSIRKRVPNSLTTWTITGFSLDPLRGLGLVNSKKKLKVSKKFVVNLNLPYSLIRGEVISVPVVVFNHFDRDINAEITIHNSEQRFEFVAPSNELNATLRIELYRRKYVKVKKHSSSTVSFMIRPTILGRTDIKVTASGDSETDAVEKILVVKAEGETQYYSKTLLIDLRRSSSFKNNITVEIPKNAVPGSEYVEVSAVGDFLGPTIMNLGHLVTYPAGSGEQNLFTMIPDAIILNYLRNKNQLTPTIRKRAVDDLERGYQQQLGYKQKDGSFSSFGTTDKNGSVWVTSLVGIAFKKAQSHIYIDENVILDALQWLSNQQAPNGSFPETGTVVHGKVQSVRENSLALTSFVAMSFYENQKLSPEFGSIVKRALDYVARNLDEHEDVYTVALASYVLHATNHPSKNVAMNILESKAKVNNSMKWWGEDIPKSEERNPWNYRPKSMDIEATSFALLTYLARGLLDDAIPVLDWLLSKGNQLGGFASTLDTAVALLALSKTMERITTANNMKIKFAYRRQETNAFNINRDNDIVVQKLQIGSNAKQINVTAEGSGMALLRVNYQYNMNTTGPWPMFTLDPQVDKNSNKYHLQLSVCTAFVSRNLTEYSESNMAIMDVHLPSGFTADIDSLPSLEVSQNVKRVETKNDDSTIVLYFDKMIREEYCPTISAFKTYSVAKQRAVPVIICDYYDTSRKARVFYYGHTASLCDVCEAEDCENVCTLDPETQRSESEGGRGSVSTPLNAFCIVTIVYTLLNYF